VSVQQCMVEDLSSQGCGLWVVGGMVSFCATSGVLWHILGILDDALDVCATTPEHLDHTDMDIRATGDIY
jgi:hypothetical protein